MNLAQANAQLANHPDDPIVLAIDAIAEALQKETFDANCAPDMRGRDRHYNAGRMAALSDFRTLLARHTRSQP